MLNSLKLRLEVENQNAMRGLSQFDQAVVRSGANVQQHLTEQLKGAFAIGAIEEMVRRTGEYNLELDRTADKLQVSREHLQAMRILAEHAGVSVDKISAYYTKMEAASLKALNGNQKLKESFKALRTSATEVNSAFMSGDKEAQGNLLAKMAGARGNPGGETALMEIFGPKSVTDINSIGRQLGGGSIGDYAKAHDSQIIPEQQVKENAKAWEQFLDNLKSLAVQLNGPMGILLKIVEGFSNMVNGTYQSLKSFMNLKKWFTQEGSDENWIRMGSVGRTAANTVPQLASGIVNRVGKIFGFNPNKDWHWMDDPRKAYGNALTEEKYRQSEGMGDTLTTVASFGVGPAARVLGLGVKGTGAAANLLRAEGTAGKLGALGERLGGMTGGKSIADRLVEAAIKNPKGEAISGVMKDLGMGMSDVSELNSADGAALRGLIEERLAPQLAKQGFVKKLVGSLGYVGAGYAAGNRDVHASLDHEDAQRAFGSGAAHNAAMSSMTGLSFAGGSGNAAVGGVFGVNIQGKIISLNQRMVSLLEKIVSNTNPLRDVSESLVGNQDEWVGN